MTQFRESAPGQGSRERARRDSGTASTPVLVVAGSVAINFLELFVAFLQAFIFTFLTTLFIGMSVVLHDDGDHHEVAAAH